MLRGLRRACWRASLLPALAAVSPCPRRYDARQVSPARRDNLSEAGRALPALYDRRHRPFAGRARVCCVSASLPGLRGAQKAWIDARVGWERAEVFTSGFVPDLDREIDGWPNALRAFMRSRHVCSAPNGPTSEPETDALILHLADLDVKIHHLTLTPQGLLNGTARLAYEVGESKADGGESAFSGTSLNDMRNNVDGIEHAYETIFAASLEAAIPSLRPATAQKNRRAEDTGRRSGSQAPRPREAARRERGAGRAAADGGAEDRVAHAHARGDRPVNRGRRLAPSQRFGCCWRRRPWRCWPCRSPDAPFRCAASKRCCRPAPSSTRTRSTQPRELFRSEAIGGAKSYLVNLGDLAFSSPSLLGGVARQAGISCSTCHVNGTTNPQALHSRPVDAVPAHFDTTGALFNAKADDGVLDPVTRPEPARRAAISRLMAMTGGSRRCAISSATSSSTSSPAPSRRRPSSTRWSPISRTSISCPIRASAPGGRLTAPAERRRTARRNAVLKAVSP